MFQVPPIRRQVMAGAKHRSAAIAMTLRRKYAPGRRRDGHRLPLLRGAAAQQIETPGVQEGEKRQKDHGSNSFRQSQSGLDRSSSIWCWRFWISRLSTIRDRSERARERRCLLTDSRLSSESSRMFFMLYETWDAPRLFTRFYRGKDRNRTPPQGVCRIHFFPASRPPAAVHASATISFFSVSSSSILRAVARSRAMQA